MEGPSLERHSRNETPNVLLRALGLAYAVTAFLGTFAFFATFVVFLGNLPKASEPWISPSADVGPSPEGNLALIAVLLWNAALLILFSLQHSGMARPAVKRLLSHVIPAPLERATYVHAANLAGFLVILLWQPIPIVLWHSDNDVIETVLWTAFGAGWLLLFAAALSIGLFELLGLRQGWAWYHGRTPPPLELKTNWIYRHLEHPMYVGVILGFWMTPHMTLGHAALAAQFTLYIAVAMRYEQSDLRARFGRSYDRWRAHAAPLPPQRLPTFMRNIGAELSRHHPIAAQPLPGEMRMLLARL